MVRKLAVRFSPSLSISFTGFSTPEHRLAAAPPLTAVSSAPPALARAAALDQLPVLRACSPTYPRSKPSPGRPFSAKSGEAAPHAAVNPRRRRSAPPPLALTRSQPSNLDPRV